MTKKYSKFKVITDDEEYNSLPEFASDIEQPIDANDSHSKFPVSRTPVTHRNVVLHNYLVRSAQCLTLAEKRILMYGIAKIGGVNQDIKISAMDYAEAYDIELNTAYEQLKDSANKLRSRFLSWQIRDGRKIGVRNTQWLQGYDYYDKEGYVKFRFSSYIHEYLFDLYQDFTKYQLKQACAFKSIHSWRLLELFEMMKGDRKNGWLSLPIEEFYHAMEVKDGYKTNFSKLRTRIIEPAVKELQLKDEWEIEWRTVKRGRKVVTLLFKFQRNPQGSLFNQDSAPLPNKRTSKKKAHELATEQDVEEWVKSRTGGKITFSDDYIKKFAKQLYKYQTDKFSLSEDTIMQIEAALRFFGMDIPK